MDAKNGQFRGQPQDGCSNFNQRRVKVLVVDDDAELCRALHILIDASPLLACVGEARSSAETFARARELDPDVILIDTSMGAAKGIDCTRALATLMPKTSLVVMTEVHDPQGVAGALMAGAKEYLFKPFSGSECHEAILHAFSGGVR